MCLVNTSVVSNSHGHLSRWSLKSRGWNQAKLEQALRSTRLDQDKNFETKAQAQTHSSSYFMFKLH